jgi:hypothetical protein
MTERTALKRSSKCLMDVLFLMEYANFVLFRPILHNAISKLDLDDFAHLRFERWLIFSFFIYRTGVLEVFHWPISKHHQSGHHPLAI